MHVRQVGALADLDREQWDSTLAQHAFYGSTGWLDVAERTADIPPFYLLTESATLPCYPLSVDSPFPFCRIEFLVRNFLPDAGDLGARLMPALVLGGRNPGHTGFGLARAADPLAAARALASAAEAAALDRGLRSVGMLYVDDDNEVARQVLAERGYASFPHARASVLDVPAGSLEDYVRSLGEYAVKAVRPEMRKIERAGVSFTHRPFGPDIADRVDELEAELNHKYGSPFDDKAVRRLRDTLVAALGDQVMVSLAHRDGRAVGSVIVFRWRDELYVRTTGFDYAAIEGVPVYFGLLFYDLVSRAQRDGVRTIHYSTGTEDAKRRRGCRQVLQHAYVKAFDPGLHAEFAAAAAARP
ncbi:GNAT family N-acetyltransferase [Kutzneria sp. NPDC052558]|uniref:GNAT family N-acetyltransferase n=1 Tax=Kutzneria sp. NPDC052558 TaxID=3364121 RepID=UPI0037C8B21A